MDTLASLKEKHCTESLKRQQAQEKLAALKAELAAVRAEMGGHSHR
jgi:hypothetical protein